MELYLAAVNGAVPDWSDTFPFGSCPGVWDVSNVLEATFHQGEFEPHTLSIEVEDVPGVLNQVRVILHLHDQAPDVLTLQCAAQCLLSRSPCRGRTDIHADHAQTGHRRALSQHHIVVETAWKQPQGSV